MGHRRTPAGELVCTALLFAYLLWVPLPFGSTPDAFQLPLVTGALVVCAATTAMLASAKSRITLSPAHRAWSVGAVSFMLIVAFQLVALPAALLRLLSPESSRRWNDATNVASFVLGRLSTWHPISVDPAATALHLFRLIAYFATFIAAALLLRRHTRRMFFAVVLACSALFQAVYGFQEAATHRFFVWGWQNKLIFDRATGTFVNPNHFAHYAALAAPFGAFLLAVAWHEASQPGASLSYRLLRVVERRVVPAAFGVITVGGCLVAILLSKSRGALLALFAGAAVGLAAATGRRVVRTALVLLAGAAAVLAITLYLGRDRTSASRFVPTATEARTLGGRRSGIETALAIWKRYPLFGSGLGTFILVAPMVQPDEAERVMNHAHDDYAEILATTGAIGFVAFLVPLAVGLVRFVRSAFGSDATTWRRRAFHASALASIAVALVHALTDFNFFIPANAVTLAAIAGAAVATRSENAGLRGSSLEDSQF